MDKTQKLKNALLFSKQNPNDQRSLELRRQIESGQYDNELAMLGYDLNKIKGITPSVEKPKIGLLPEEIQRAGKRFATTFEKAETPLEKVAAIGTLPLRAVGVGARAVGRTIAEPLAPLAQKVFSALRPEAQEDLRVFGQKLGEKLQQVKQKIDPEIYQSLADIVEVAGFYTGGKGTQAGFRAARPTLEAGIQTGREVVETGIQTGKEFIETGVEKGREVIQKGREKITGVSVKTGEAKVIDDSLSIAREKITPAYEERAALDQRSFKEGRLGEVKYRPTRREELISNSLEPLVREGRIKVDALPFENIPPISQEVSRINQAVRNFIADRKVPFNEKQLRKKLEEVKQDSEIIFTTDPTLQRTYDSLIDAFVNDVKKKDTLGLFNARQSFDKIPAVKKLLDGLKGAEGENLRRQAALDIRRAANEYISDLLPPNNPYLYLLKQESFMIEAMTNLAEKSKGLGGTTNIERIFNQHPLLKLTVRRTIAFGAGAVIF